MFYLTLRKKKYIDNSFVLLLYNSKKRIIRKCGVLFFENKLNKFVFYVDYFSLLKLFNYNFVLTNVFFKIFYKFVNIIRL